MPRFMINRGALAAIASAALFGASTPLAKRLIGEGVDAWLLAGLFYLGSGLGLGLWRLSGRLGGHPPAETALDRGDLPWLGLAVLSGGIVAPVLLMFGLSRTPASSAALLLNVESLATMSIAWLVFHESVDRRLLIGALAILAGALLLSWQGGPTVFGLGALAILGACLGWGVDNNLTRRLSSADPVQIATIKGLVAGAVNLGLAFWRGARAPTPLQIGAAGIIGFFSYGVSLALFVLALRRLGSARTGAYFSTAPFIGAVLAVGLFGEPLTLRLILAAGLMGLGLYLHLAEQHEHKHAHGALDHAHRHVHDEHHQHEHGPDDPPGEAHAHRHRHAPLIHSHPHYPDLHHRHGHR